MGKDSQGNEYIRCVEDTPKIKSGRENKKFIGRRYIVDQDPTYYIENGWNKVEGLYKDAIKVTDSYGKAWSIDYINDTSFALIAGLSHHIGKLDVHFLFGITPRHLPRLIRQTQIRHWPALKIFESILYFG